MAGARGSLRGGPCSIYIDHRAGDAPGVGDGIVTPTGQGYLVLDARTVTRGPNAGTRTHLTCERMPAGELPAGTPIRGLRWYRRERKHRP